MPGQAPTGNHSPAQELPQAAIFFPRVPPKQRQDQKIAAFGSYYGGRFWLKTDQPAQRLVSRGLQPCARTLSTGRSTIFGGKCKSWKPLCIRLCEEIRKFFA
jgi:hypothetical protein